MNAIQIKELSKFGITQPDQINLVKRALNQKNDSLVQDILAPKKWKQLKSALQIIKSQPTVYFRHPNQIKPSSNPGQPVKCIVLGPCGSGKTSFINHLCGTNLPSGQTGESLTRDITQVPSSFQYETPFIIYDTPGTTAHVQKLRHAIMIKQILQHKPVNCIAILCKYENRDDQLLNTLYNQILMIPGYQENLLFLVTHFDMAKQPQKTIQRINQMMVKKMPQFKNQMIFFSNQTINEKELSDSIYNTIKSFCQRPIKIGQKTFYEFFNLKKEKSQILYMKTQQKLAKKQMEQVRDIFIDATAMQADNQERDLIFQQMELQLKNQLLDILEQFTKKCQNTMVDYEYYESFYTLQILKNQCIEKYQTKIRGLQKHSLIQNTATGSKTDIRELIKKCPKPDCGLIWFRIQACPNTSCGNRPSCIFDFVKRPIFEYQFILDKKTKKLKVVKKQQKKNDKKGCLNKDTILKGDSQSIQNRVKKNKLGCGTAMNFETLPILPNIQQLLKEWYNLPTIDQVIKAFQADQQLQKTRKKIEEEARKSFWYFKW